MILFCKTGTRENWLHEFQRHKLNAWTDETVRSVRAGWRKSWRRRTGRSECWEHRPGRVNSGPGDTAGWRWQSASEIEGERWGVKGTGHNTGGCWGGESGALNCWCKQAHTLFVFTRTPLTSPFQWKSLRVRRVDASLFFLVALMIKLFFPPLFLPDPLLCYVFHTTPLKY